MVTCSPCESAQDYNTSTVLEENVQRKRGRVLSPNKGMALDPKSSYRSETLRCRSEMMRAP